MCSLARLGVFNQYLCWIFRFSFVQLHWNCKTSGALRSVGIQLSMIKHNEKRNLLYPEKTTKNCWKHCSRKTGHLPLFYAASVPVQKYGIWQPLAIIIYYDICRNLFSSIIYSFLSIMQRCMYETSECRYIFWTMNHVNVSVLVQKIVDVTAYFIKLNNDVWKCNTILTAVCSIPSVTDFRCCIKLL